MLWIFHCTALFLIRAPRECPGSELVKSVDRVKNDRPFALVCRLNFMQVGTVNAQMYIGHNYSKLVVFCPALRSKRSFLVNRV